MKVTVTNDEDAAQRLRIYGTQLDTWRGYWRGVGADLARAQREWWASSGGGTWERLAASTVREKARLGYGRRPILVRSGLLRNRLTRQYSFMVFRAPNTALLEIPPDVAYGVYHQSRAPRTKLPRRPLFVPNSKVRQVARARAVDHVQYRRTRA